jgi:hypothetical protein
MKPTSPRPVPCPRLGEFERPTECTPAKIESLIAATASKIPPMHRWPPFNDTGPAPTEAGRLPELLAEYGRLAAQLPHAEHQRAQQLHNRLHELDTIIDRLIDGLGTTRL